MRRAVLVLAMALALCASEAQARTTIVAADARWPYQGWVDAAKVPTPSVTLAVVDGSSHCEGATACTARGLFTVWDGSHTRQTFYHELGHNFDYYSLPDWARLRYMEILGLEEWDRELFAASYELCALKQRVRPGIAVQGQEPVGGHRVHNRVCRMLSRLDP